MQEQSMVDPGDVLNTMVPTEQVIQEQQIPVQDQSMTYPSESFSAPTPLEQISQVQQVPQQENNTSMDEYGILNQIGRLTGTTTNQDSDNSSNTNYNIADQINALTGSSSNVEQVMPANYSSDGNGIMNQIQALTGLTTQSNQSQQQSSNEYGFLAQSVNPTQTDSSMLPNNPNLYSPFNGEQQAYSQALNPYAMNANKYSNIQKL